MNEYLQLFIDDVIRNNDYYQDIRDVFPGKEALKRAIDDLVVAYDDDCEYFGPYKYLDGIEDYIRTNKEYFMNENMPMMEIIIRAFDEGFMENY